MAGMKVQSAVATSSASCCRPQLPLRRACRMQVRAQAQNQQSQADLAFEVGKIASITTVASSWLVAGNAQAASELALIAAADNRLAIISTLFVPALGWVAFNILGPLGNQLAKMQEENGVPVKKSGTAKASKAATAKRSVAAAVGLGAAAFLLSSQTAEASTELLQLAESDNRVGVIATLFVPALAWVGFNILGPLNNQLAKMQEENGVPAKKTGTKKVRSVAGLVGASAAAMWLSAQSAEASTELLQIAESDNRAGIIFTLLIPALGWVGFNILGPLGNQLAKMQEENGVPAKKTGTKKVKSVAAVVGLTAAAMLSVSDSALASTELAQIAESDNRATLLFTLLVPALGWVAFNILGPFGNQLAKMQEENGVPVKKSGTAKATGKKATR